MPTYSCSLLLFSKNDTSFAFMVVALRGLRRAVTVSGWTSDSKTFGGYVALKPGRHVARAPFGDICQTRVIQVEE